MVVRWAVHGVAGLRDAGGRSRTGGAVNMPRRQRCACASDEGDVEARLEVRGTVSAGWQSSAKCDRGGRRAVDADEGGGEREIALAPEDGLIPDSGSRDHRPMFARVWRMLNSHGSTRDLLSSLRPRPTSSCSSASSLSSPFPAALRARKLAQGMPLGPQLHVHPRFDSGAFQACQHITSLVRGGLREVCRIV